MSEPAKKKSKTLDGFVKSPDGSKSKTLDGFVKSPDGSKSSKQSFKEFLDVVNQDRSSAGEDISDFKFNKKRVRVLSKAQEVPERAKGILYWMTREQRVQDNWTMLYAQKLAMKNEVPLHVCFCLRPKFMDATIRHYLFMLKGLKEVSEECIKLNIEFHLLFGEAEKLLPEFVQKNSMGALVTDFSPLRVAVSWVDKLKDQLPKDVPLCQVDGHNIVPCWVASEKLEYGARTIRNKINSKLDEFLTKFPDVCKHPFSSNFKAKSIDWEKAEKTIQVDTSVGEVSWAKPGYTAGMEVLYEFCTNRLRNFATKRNDPTTNSLSNLSSWFHFGQVSVQRCILVVRQHKSKHKESVEAFCEEAIVRRELADNFCFYNPKYDSIDGAYDWAKKTLNDHRKDKREYVYSRDELDQSLTHDDLWNSAQIQLVKEGKMHGFLRMYWAKKILEWTSSPEEALSVAIYLNDRYSMDGRDPNGFVGCMWSICGIHDQGWAERAVFGKIRFMNYQGCKRKFDINAFISRYGGKVHKKKQ